MDGWMDYSLNIFNLSATICQCRKTAALDEIKESIQANMINNLFLYQSQNKINENILIG